MKGDHMGTDPAHPSPRELPLSNQTRFSFVKTIFYSRPLENRCPRNLRRRCRGNANWLPDLRALAWSTCGNAQRLADTGNTGWYVGLGGSGRRLRDVRCWFIGHGVSPRLQPTRAATCPFRVLPPEIPRHTPVRHRPSHNAHPTDSGVSRAGAADAAPRVPAVSTASQSTTAFSASRLDAPAPDARTSSYI